MLARDGYLVASVDNRGTGGRGARFMKMTYLHLGRYESTDQIAAARWFGQQPFVSADRIGIWGWSYGGGWLLHALVIRVGGGIITPRRQAFRLLGLDCWRHTLATMGE